MDNGNTVGNVMWLNTVWVLYVEDWCLMGDWLMQRGDCWKARWKIDKLECELLGGRTQESMKHEFGKHLKYNWDNVWMVKGLEKLWKVYAIELKFVVFTEYGLRELLWEKGVLNVEEWKKRCEKDYLQFELTLRGMGIEGRDYWQYEIQLIRWMRLGSGEWEENMLVL